MLMLTDCCLWLSPSFCRSLVQFMIYTGLGANATGGLFDQITSTDTTLLQAKFGINSPFTFIVRRNQTE